MASGDGRTFQYTRFNKPNRISKGSEVSTFTYGPDQARFKKVNTGTVASTTYYIGAYEKEIRDGHTYHRIQLGDFAIVEKVDSNAEKVTYTLRDDLNTLIATVSETGEVKRLFYDPWGKRMDLPTIEDAQPIDIISLANFGINRGFTNHEHLDNVELIHMNGRVYDPEIARFTSADPFINKPTYLQSYNRYSYVWNSPLRLVDPSGFREIIHDPHTDDKIRREKSRDRKRGGNGFSKTEAKERIKHDYQNKRQRKAQLKRLDYYSAKRNNILDRLEKNETKLKKKGLLRSSLATLKLRGTAYMANTTPLLWLKTRPQVKYI
jgi:RHS repeat-associated core domain